MHRAQGRFMGEAWCPANFSNISAAGLITLLLHCSVGTTGMTKAPAVACPLSYRHAAALTCLYVTGKAITTHFDCPKVLAPVAQLSSVCTFSSDLLPCLACKYMQACTLSNLPNLHWGLQARGDEEFLEADADVGPDGEGGADEDEEVPSSGLPWEGSDRDYIYEELLGTHHASSSVLGGRQLCLQTWLCKTSTSGSGSGSCRCYQTFCTQKIVSQSPHIYCMSCPDVGAAMVMLLYREICCSHLLTALECVSDDSQCLPLLNCQML